MENKSRSLVRVGRVKIDESFKMSSGPTSAIELGLKPSTPTT